MEFPDLGQHCAENSCHRLDFLPMKCDACSKVFCSAHFNYKQHACSGAFKNDVQVPVCPLCGEPVPTAPDEEPDFTVDRHINQRCKSDTKKIFTNRCRHKGCKRKELIPIQCSMCKQNYCLRHRHTTDHNCKGAADAKTLIGTSGTQIDQRTMAAKAAEYRRSNKPTTLFSAETMPNDRAPGTRQGTTFSQLQTIQGNMSEDEALARALAMSIMELDETAERDRRNAAAATTQRLPVVSGNQQQGSSKDKCSLS